MTNNHNLAANTIRTLAMDAVQKANNGHPGMPMGMADVGVVLWRNNLKHNPADPHWADRDRFILSGGHGSMLLYALLHLTGYKKMTLDEIKKFRSLGSLTPGHPENFVTEGVETTTGPLGQGIGNAVGFAIAERWLAAHFNRPDFPIVDHYTYAMCGDGDLMEGISHEIASLAGHLGLGKLIVFYDDNEITIDGKTSLSWSDDVSARFRAYNWQTIIIDGHDPEEIQRAIDDAKTVPDKPTLIITKTHIGFGSPNKQDTASAHGSPLGEEEVLLTKRNLGWEYEEPFIVPAEAKAYMSGANGANKQAEWDGLFAKYEKSFPDLARTFGEWMVGELPANYNANLPTFEAGTSIATRASSGKVLGALTKNIPNMIGGSADLTGSNKTDFDTTHLTKDDFSGRYIYYGIREHGMAAVMNGMYLHGGVRPFGGTFFVFTDYMRPSMRLAALMGLPIVYVLTHDSIGLGMDGPTHQPIEHLMSLRVMPNMTTFRPADANEVAVGWQVALENGTGPTSLVLTRQGVPTLDQTKYASAENARKGAYVLSDMDEARVILIGTGSEVHIALEAQALLATGGIPSRVVSMPSWELFEAQSSEYKMSVLPDSISKRVAVEAGSMAPWRSYVGMNGGLVGMTRFGASAPGGVLYEKFGITAERVAEVAKSLFV
jgi:transketolase